MGPGSITYLPVRAPGARLFIGDAHACQGDGEVCGVAVEYASTTTIQVDLIKGWTIEWPRLENEEVIMAIGSARPLEDAARIAYRELILWMEADYGFDRWDAYMMLSQCGQVRLGNFVDPKYTVGAAVLKKYLPIGHRCRSISTAWCIRRRPWTRQDEDNALRRERRRSTRHSAGNVIGGSARFRAAAADQGRPARGRIRRHRPMGSPSSHGSQLAVEEIKGRRHLGRKIELIHLDPQMRQCALPGIRPPAAAADKVDVLVAGFASAEREAIRPIVDQFKPLYFYTNQYEGGVCDANTFCTGPVCEQQFPTLYYGREVRPAGLHHRRRLQFRPAHRRLDARLIPQVGGQIIGEEFIPLRCLEFSSGDPDIQQAKPDWVMTLPGRRSAELLSRRRRPPG